MPPEGDAASPTGRVRTAVQRIWLTVCVLAGGLGALWGVGMVVVATSANAPGILVWVGFAAMIVSPLLARGLYRLGFWLSGN